MKPGRKLSYLEVWERWPEMHIKKDLPVLFLYLLGFLVMTMTMALYQPLQDTPPLYANPPDEHSRYLIPQYICRYGELPTGLEEEVRIPGYGISYALFNVFPYIVQGYLMRLTAVFTDSETALLYTARMVNVFFGVFMAIMVYLISKQVFSDRRFGWLFCFAVMYLPESLFVHTYVNTDSCCMLATSMIVYALIKGYKEGFRLGNCLWLCAGIILCALSYYNAYGYILCSIFLFAAYYLRGNKEHFCYDWKTMLKTGLFISAIVLLGISWWFIRQYHNLDGDFLGLATRETMAIQYAVDEVNPSKALTYQKAGYTIWQMMKERGTLDGAFMSFVAAYGSVSILSTIWLYRAYKVFFTLGIVGVIFWLLNRKFFFKERRKMCGREIFFHFNMLLCILIPIGLLIYYAYTVDYQDQGRYALPIVIPLMFYIVKGIEKLTTIRFKEYTIPGWLIHAGLFFCFFLIIGGTVEMVFFRSLPIYLMLR